MCNENKQKLLENACYSGKVEFCGDSQFNICNGKELTEVEYNAQACTSALNEDAVKKSSSGPWISPTPDGMSAPIGDDCNLEYWYCKNSGKIHRERAKFDADPSCQAPTDENDNERNKEGEKVWRDDQWMCPWMPDYPICKE